MSKFASALIVAVISTTAVAQENTSGNAVDGWTIDNGELSLEGEELHAIPASDSRPNYFIAPSRYFGDWLEYQEIAFDKKSSGGAYTGGGVIVLRNGNMRATLRSFPEHHTGEWRTFHVPLTPGDWTLGGGTESLEAVLANITGFEIAAEYARGADQAAIRNIELK